MYTLHHMHVVLYITIKLLGHVTDIITADLAGENPLVPTFVNTADDRFFWLYTFSLP